MCKPWKRKSLSSSLFSQHLGLSASDGGNFLVNFVTWQMVLHMEEMIGKSENSNIIKRQMPLTSVLSQVRRVVILGFSPAPPWYLWGCFFKKKIFFFFFLNLSINFERKDRVERKLQHVSQVLSSLIHKEPFSKKWIRKEHSLVAFFWAYFNRYFTF